MDKKKSKKERAKSAEKIIRLAYDSLESHLPYTYLKSSEGDKFHREAIKQYIDIINEAYKLY